MDPVQNTAVLLSRHSLPAESEHRWRKFNLLHGLGDLRHRYLAQRHGPTAANQQGLYLGEDRENLFTSQVLPDGHGKLRASVEGAAANGLLDERTIIVCSDFIRSMQSALTAAEVLGSRRIILSPLLRERGCGDLRGRWSDMFPEVEELDRIDPEHRTFGVESVCSVSERFSGLIQTLEAKYPEEERTFLFAAHCELIQIGACVFAFDHPGHYTRFGMVDNGEIVHYQPGRGASRV